MHICLEPCKCVRGDIEVAECKHKDSNGLFSQGRSRLLRRAKAQPDRPSLMQMSIGNVKMGIPWPVVRLLLDAGQEDSHSTSVDLSSHWHHVTRRNRNGHK